MTYITILILRLLIKIMIIAITMIVIVTIMIIVIIMIVIMSIHVYIYIYIHMESKPWYDLESYRLKPFFIHLHNSSDCINRGCSWVINRDNCHTHNPGQPLSTMLKYVQL